MPFSTMRAIWASENFCTFGFSTMLGPRSPPRPSRPWQFAQVDAKICLLGPRVPRAEAGVTFFCWPPCCEVCVHAPMPVAAHKAAKTSASRNSDLGRGTISNTHRLENQLQGKLHNARIARASHKSKTALSCVVNLSRWVHELGVVENIERLGTELQLHTFRQPCIFQQGEVKVVDARPTEEPAHGVSDLPNWFGLEVSRVEIWHRSSTWTSLIARITVSKKRTANNARLINCGIECATERIVIGFTKLYRFTFGESRDPRHLPSGREYLCGAASKLLEGQLDAAAHR